MSILKFMKPRIVLKCFPVRFINTSKLSEKDVEEIEIPVPWGHIAGKWWGDKKEPPVVAIHGWQDNANSFDRLIPLLNLQSVLAIDLPGHGKSSHFPEGISYDFVEYVVALHRIKKHFNWPEIPLLTHSLGGAVGYVYAATFPDDIRWLINIECIRCLLALLKYDCCSKMSLAIDEFLKIEKYKQKKLNPSYKLSQLILMTMEGSLGSIYDPEAALLLLKRVILASDNIVSTRITQGSSDLEKFLVQERAQAKKMSGEDQEDMKKFFESLKQSLNTARENLKNFSLDESVDKYYTLIRDPSIKVLMLQTCDDEFLLKAAESIKCPVLSIRTKDGFLVGASKKLFEETLDILKTSSPYMEHHDIDGTHHVHLVKPENLAPIINNFIKKTSSSDFKNYQ